MPIIQATGTVVPDMALDRHRRYEIRVSAANDQGATTSAVRRDLLPVRQVPRGARRS